MAALSQAGLSVSGATWVLPTWKWMRYARCGWMPSVNERFEFRVEADRVVRGPRADYVTVQMRRPVVMLRHGAPAGLASWGQVPERLAAIALANAQDAVAVDRCFLCRATLGRGHPRCPICATTRVPFWRRVLGAAPVRTRVRLASDLRIHAVVAYEKVGEITLRLARGRSPAASAQT